MGVCFGKPCSTDARSSAIQRRPAAPSNSAAVADAGHRIKMQGTRNSSRLRGQQTFQELLAKRAEEPSGTAYIDFNSDLPLTKTEVWVKHQNGALRSNVRVQHRTAFEDFPVFETGATLSTVNQADHADSFSSFRGDSGSLATASVYGDVIVVAPAVAGNTTPVYSGRRTLKEFGSSNNSLSCEIIEETGSDSSVSNELFIKESFTELVEEHQPKEKVIMVDSRCGSQDVLSLEEFCRISEMTSQASSCSEADPKEVTDSETVRDDGVSSCTRYTRCVTNTEGGAAEAGEYKRVELSFVDFLCSQSHRLQTDNVSGSPDQQLDEDEINGFMKAMQISSSTTSSGSLRRISFTDNSGRKLCAQSPASNAKTPPSTPGSFKSTPFGSVGSSFSMDELSMRRPLSPCTPLSASFTSAGVLSLEEMTAIWSAFQEGQMVQ